MTGLPLRTRTPALGWLNEPAVSRLLFADPRLAPLWLLLRVYVGYEWLMASWGKLVNPGSVWVGEKAGVAVTGFLKGALAKTGGEHPDVQGGYGLFRSLRAPSPVPLAFLTTDANTGLWIPSCSPVR